MILDVSIGSEGLPLVELTFDNELPPAPEPRKLSEGSRKALRQINLVRLMMQRPRGVTMAEICQLEGYDDLPWYSGTDPNTEQKRAIASLRRRFQRDKDELRDMGALIEAVEDPDSPKHLRFRLAPQCLLTDQLAIEPEEMMLLDAMARAFGDVSGTETQRLLLTAIAKIKAGSEGASYVSQVSAPVLKRNIASSSSEMKNFDVCFIAHTQCLPIRFSYQGAGDVKARERNIEPWTIVKRGTAVYVVGRDRDLGEIRVFKVGRMRGKVRVMKSAEPFKVPKGFRAEDHFSSAPLTASGGKGTLRNVVIHFDADVGFIIANDFKGVHPIVERRDGSVTLSIATAHPAELFRYLADFAGHFEVRSPKELVHDFKARVEETLGVYDVSHE